MKHLLALFLLNIFSLSVSAQYSRQDSLRGSITPERVWWDLQHYELAITVDPDTRFISGTNIVQYRVLESNNILQIDLQSPLTIDNVVQDGQPLKVRHDGNAHFITLLKPQQKGTVNEITITYSGKPHVAENAPWDGGITWSKDDNGKPFIATSCQGIGASIWWPCKDHQYDEPDNGMVIRINVPSDLVAVSNGRLKSRRTEKNKTRTFTWEVVNPINNYSVNMNIGDYVSFSEKYTGEKGILDMDYWVLRQNLNKAKVHFKDAVRTMQAFEHWFGPYPFYEDSYKLVEVPYLGMEHQSSVTYGNKYMKGYLGTDLSSTGEGLKWDFIIVHETGHEWFGNNITTIDIADMWVHEGFTSYSESLFTEYHYGKEAASAYTRGLRARIENRSPIIGDYEVNAEGSGDMYYKGHNMLHTLRQLVNDDAKWRQILRGLNKKFYHQTVTSKQIETFLAEQSGLNLTAFFNQYLRDYRVPVLEYWINDDVMIYRWSNCINTFDMPLQIFLNGRAHTIHPTVEFGSLKLDQAGARFNIDPDYYVYSFNLFGE